MYLPAYLVGRISREVTSGIIRQLAAQKYSPLHDVIESKVDTQYLVPVLPRDNAYLVPTLLRGNAYES